MGRYEITLTKKQKEKVRAVIKDSKTRPNVKMRGRIALRVAKGHSDLQISEDLDVSVTTIKRVRKSVNVDGINYVLQPHHPKKYTLELSKADVEYLKGIRKSKNKSKTVRRRARIYLALHNGRTYNEIMDKMNVTAALIWRLISKAQERPIQDIVEPTKFREPEVFSLEIPKKMRNELKAQNDTESKILLAATKETTYQDISDKLNVPYLKVWRTITEYTS